MWESYILFWVYEISVLAIGIFTVRELYFKQPALKKIDLTSETLKDLQKQINDLSKIVWDMQKTALNNIKL